MEKWVGAIIAVVFIVILGLVVYHIFGESLIPYISDRVKNGVDTLMGYLSGTHGGTIVPDLKNMIA